MPLNPFDFFRDGYHQGLIAAADFLKSGKTFEQWYGVEPDIIDAGWAEILDSLDRKQEYYDLKNKIEGKHENRF